MNDLLGTMPNLQKAWDLDIASDRLIFKKVLFDDPGIKFALLPEMIQSNQFVTSVEYNGTTKYFEVQMDLNLLSKDPVYKDVDFIFVMGAIGASALQKVILSGSYLDSLVIEKQKQAGMDYVQAYNYMVSYIEQPRLLNMFFRAFHYRNGKVAYEFA